jgi:hypothetical protein
MLVNPNAEKRRHQPTTTNRVLVSEEDADAGDIIENPTDSDDEA